MRRNAKIDMTRGPMLPAIVRFALPILLGTLLQMLYHTADTLVIGNFCGSASLAALGTSGQPVEILINVFMGLGAGASILVAQYMGSGEKDKLRSVASTAVSFLYLCAIPMTAVGWFVGPVILRGMNVPADTFALASSYMRITFLGTLFNLGYNLNAGVLRGMGDSQSSLWFLVLSCSVNIVLDVLFVAGFHMDVAGAALATIIAQAVSWIVSILYIRRRYPEVCFPFLPRSVDGGMMKELTRLGVPLGINNSFYSVGHLLMQSLINLQGAAFIAGCSVASKMNSFSNLTTGALSTATATFAGQNYGARSWQRLKKAARIPFCSALISLISGVVLVSFAQPLAAMFSDDPQVIFYAVRYMRVVMPMCWAYALFNAIISLANAIGEIRYPTIVNILMLWVVRIPVAHLIARVVDGTWVMAAVSISFVFGMVCMLFFFRSHRWREVRNLAKAA
ncbi:MAG: MATE family efflux transporter [bacterium]|nr:MATE family efflux transporter [bacterium]